MLEVSISLPSGCSEKLSIEESSKVGDLRMLAQKSFGYGFLRLITSEGCLLVDPMESLQTAGIEDGDHLTALAIQANVAATKTFIMRRGAFAVWCIGANRIVTLGPSPIWW